MKEILSEREIDRLLGMVDNKSYKETLAEKTNEARYFNKLVSIANFLHDEIRPDDINLVIRAIRDRVARLLKKYPGTEDDILIKDIILNVEQAGDDLYQELLDKDLELKNKSVHEEMREDKSLLLTKEEQEELIQAVKDREDEE